MVFTGNEVGLEVIRELTAWEKSKIGVVNGVIKQAQRIRSWKNQKVSIFSDYTYDSVAYDPAKTRLLESAIKA